MEGNVMTLEDLGDEIMVLEGDPTPTEKPSTLQRFFKPTGTVGWVLLGSFGASSATAVFNERYRKPAIAVAVLTGLANWIRADMEKTFS
jgi:hypothetical protein